MISTFFLHPIYIRCILFRKSHLMHWTEMMHWVLAFHLSSPPCGHICAKTYVVWLRALWCLVWTLWRAFQLGTTWNIWLLPSLQTAVWPMDGWKHSQSHMSVCISLLFPSARKCKVGLWQDFKGKKRNSMENNAILDKWLLEFVMSHDLLYSRIIFMYLICSENT